MKKQGNGLVLRLSELGADQVMMAFVSDIHLDQYFSDLSLLSLIQQFHEFKMLVQGAGVRGLVILAGDTIDFLTMSGKPLNEITAIGQAFTALRELQAAGIQVYRLKGNHDRRVFDEQSFQAWWQNVLPDSLSGDWLYIEDIQLLAMHGHIWDIFNRPVSGDDGRVLEPLGDLIIRRLVVPMQEAGCIDLNRVDIPDIPVYLMAKDPSGALLRDWTKRFAGLMRSKEFRRWRRAALPFGQNVIMELVKLLYGFYADVTAPFDGNVNAILQQIKHFDRGSSGYMAKRQRELVMGELEDHNRDPSWGGIAKNTRVVVTGHTHDHRVEVFYDDAGVQRAMISSGAWVKQLNVFPPTRQREAMVQTTRDVTWTEIRWDQEKPDTVEVYQKVASTITP